MERNAPVGKSCDRGETVTLYLMTHKGLETLRAAISSYRGLVSAVVVGTDPNTQCDYSDEIREECSKHGVPCFRRTDDSIPHTEYAIAVSWRWMIPLGSTKLIVMHDSILPRYRGFNPLVSAMINEEKEIGVSAFFASDEYDKGDVIDVEIISIEYPIRISEAIELIAGCYGRLTSRILQKIAENSPFDRTPQNEEDASYSLWRDEQDYSIDWLNSAEYIERFVHATGFPYQGSFSLLNDHPVRVLEAKSIDDVKIENRTPGKVIFVENGYPVVVCGSGLLKIVQLVDDKNGESLLPLRTIRSRFH